MISAEHFHFVPQSSLIPMHCINEVTVQKKTLFEFVLGNTQSLAASSCPAK
jgi:hypothetical protein